MNQIENNFNRAVLISGLEGQDPALDAEIQDVRDAFLRLQAQWPRDPNPGFPAARAWRLGIRNLELGYRLIISVFRTIIRYQKSASRILEQRGEIQLARGYRHQIQGFLDRIREEKQNRRVDRIRNLQMGIIHSHLINPRSRNRAFSHKSRRVR